MQLALAWLGKEWQAQRAVLGACVGLSFLAVTCVFWLRTIETDHGVVPVEGRAGVVVLFLAATAFAVAGLAAPQLVRGELHARGDQFLRRLPGALRPACAGKLAFLLLVACALPVLGVVAAQGLLVLRGLEALPLSWLAPAELSARLARLGTLDLLLAGSYFVLCAAPMVVAAATWLPRGRMALGAVVLVGLLLGLAVQAILGAHPNLGSVVHHESAWSLAHGIVYLVALGLVVAWFSLAHGRRGGGALRSAKLGGLTMLAGLTPPAGWLASWVYEYRVPDVHALRNFNVWGVTPDLRYVLAEGASRVGWEWQPMRIDLTTGAVDRLGPVRTTALWPHVVQRGSPRLGLRQRYWRLYRGGATFVLDAATLQCTPATFDAEAKQFVVPSPLYDEVAHEVRANTPVRAPGNRPVWVDDDRLCVETASGGVETSPWDRRDILFGARGHAAMVPQGDGVHFRWLDVTTRRFVTIGDDATAFGVGGLWLVRSKKVGWQRLDPRTGGMTPAPALEGHDLLALLDDDTVLTGSRERISDRRWRHRLFAYQAVDDRLAPIEFDASLREVDLTWIGPGNGSASTYGLRDPSGRLWLRGSVGADPTPPSPYVVIDPSTRTAGAAPVQDVAAIAFLDPRTLLAFTPARPGQLGQILRIDVESGAQTVLFPRAR